ncbi:hypothetical protein PG994_014235 [Apiospora phragmitis]|uniref:BOD1/SHG1 domain-containing protein n=1 Tax=Apiospora phragmitis TaxID=2905665 RepID=A0ABR1T3R8_9PEZI
MAASTEQTPAAATLTAPVAARKFKASDLPLTSATRSAIEGLAHSFKKKGGYDAIRKQVWEQFEASDYEKQVTKSILEVAEKEVERNPSQLLSLDRRKAAALIDGALDRSGVYQKAEDVIDQLIDAKAIEERIRDLRKTEIGDEAALAEQQRGAKTDPDYAEEASQKLAEREKLRRELKEKEEQILEEKRKIEREERKKREREQEKLEAKRVEEREARRREREEKEAEREKQRQKERDERRAAREKEREEREKEREKDREARRLERTRENADRDKDRDKSKERDRERERTKDRPREKSKDRSRHRDRDRDRDRDRRDRSRSPRRRNSRERRRRDSSRTPRDTKERRRPEESKKQLSKEELERIERDALADLLRESNGNTEKAPEVEIDEALAPPPRRVKPASAIQPLRRDSPKTALEGKKVPELTTSDSKDSVHPIKETSQIPMEPKEAKEVKTEIKIDIKGFKEPLPAKDTRSHSDSKEVKTSKDVKVSKSTDDRRGSIATSTRDKDHTRIRVEEDDRRRDRPRERKIAENPVVHENAFPSRITTVRVRLGIAVGTGAVLALAAALSAKEIQAALNPAGKEVVPGSSQGQGRVAGPALAKIATSRGSPAVPRRVPRGARDLGRRVLALKGKTEAARECARIAANAAETTKIAKDPGPEL